MIKKNKPEQPKPKDGLQNPYSPISSGQLKSLLLEIERSETNAKRVFRLLLDVVKNPKPYPDCLSSLLRWEANWILGRVHQPKVKKERTPKSNSIKESPQPRVYNSYQEYISSPEWREKSRLAKQRAGNRCQVCNRPSTIVPLHTHHRTYERLGNEKDSDLTVLCADCHTLFETHSLNRPTNQR